MPEQIELLSRKHLLTTALAYIGTPYRWGGDDPSGFDCSGFVLECLKSAGLIGEKDDFTANQLLARYSASQIESARPGALQFLCDKTRCAYHVVICLDEHFQIGASGGDSRTLSTPDAWRQNAYIKIRPISQKLKSVYVDPFK
ncbi:MAG: C40 family peptidase [bacterium]|nr:C40 family peptidase [bacterium]